MSQAAYEFGAAPPTEEPQERGTLQEVAGQAREKAEEVADQAREKLADAAGTARDKVSQAKDQAGSRITQIVDQRSTRAGQQAIQVGQSLRQTADSLREDQPGAARLVDQAAARVEGAGMYLSASDGNRILSDLEEFARRQPLLVAAGAFAAGLAAARFLKASRPSEVVATGATGPETFGASAPPLGPTTAEIVPAEEPPVAVVEMPAATPLSDEATTTIDETAGERPAL